MQNLKNVKLPSAGLISGVVQTVVYGGAATYGLYNSLFNVEGGHRAIVYNRVIGIKDKVRILASRETRVRNHSPRKSNEPVDWLHRDYRFIRLVFFFLFLFRAIRGRKLVFCVRQGGAVDGESDPDRDQDVSTSRTYVIPAR